ncbi:MAG: dihydropteroate synthase [Albidovulum sp.]|uniref:dihydropteroate synthase n=1 Tax=Albidovulum sp. TaxID=1872424 RepID=UPI003CB6C778
MIYYRPIAQTDTARPPLAPWLAGGWCWFDRLERLERGKAAKVVTVDEVPESVLQRLCAPRPDIAGLAMDHPRLMGILNVTPDSFSDGGRFHAADAALTHARGMAAAGADILDIGGESTRPGADEVSLADEISRTEPVIRALCEAGLTTPISIDTRKAEVAKAALQAGARIVNDVAALSFDPELADVVAKADAPLCLMHAQGDPATMQDDPRYDDVLLDVYDYLEGRIAVAEAAGIARERIIVDPGIGFGKTDGHNLALIRGLSLFHGLGCAILLGASRKRFIGTIGRADAADDRIPGTLAVTLAGIAQGVQLHRVHDMAEAKQALRLWQAVTLGETT